MDLPTYTELHLVNIADIETSTTLFPLSLRKANYKSPSAQVQELKARPRKRKKNAGK